MDKASVAELRGYVEYLRDLGIHDLYRHGEPLAADEIVRLASGSGISGPGSMPPTPSASQQRIALDAIPITPADSPNAVKKLHSASPQFAQLAATSPLPAARVAAEDRRAALDAVQTRLGDCTRCPLAYAGRKKIVFGDGDSTARLMFVGEGPGADEDEQGVPFVGKAGQLLNNMIAAMGLRRDQVYITNIVMCRPPENRVPEPVEAGTCSQFLVEQIDIVQPQVIVALGATAATYLLGVKQPLGSLRGRWHDCRGAKVAVTYHPAFLLRDPRQKGEAWQDLQRVMVELGLKPPVKSS